MFFSASCSALYSQWRLGSGGFVGGIGLDWCTDDLSIRECLIRTSSGSKARSEVSAESEREDHGSGSGGCSGLMLATILAGPDIELPLEGEAESSFGFIANIFRNGRQ